MTRSSNRSLILSISLLVVLVATGSVLQPERTIRPKLTDSSKISEWDLDGNGSWQVADGKLQLLKGGVPGGPIRRPAALAILRTEPFSRATLELEVRSTAPIDVARRDVDLIFGYESPSRFYYVHLSAVTDDVHNGIFLVADADRRRIDSGQGVPRMKDQVWHRIRATHDGNTGRIEVFFDSSPTPILSAVDVTIKSGRVGVGSFDDTAEFRNFKVKGSK